MDLSQLQQQLFQLPPLSVEHRTPTFCGDLPLRIDIDGQWYYQDSKISRRPLVKLFASVLLRQEQTYFLQTPVEKVRIQVEDVPFLITQHAWHAGVNGPELRLSTNLGDTVVVSAAYPLFIKTFAGQNVPYVALWRGLSARLHRNVYYHLIQEADLQETIAADSEASHPITHLTCVITSCGQPFILAEEPLV
ncbi:DUF1285 domain-containing protein [Alishewanella tabrizica]|uniref:DUF1285 domain-containing protein n=1 Tax=Alishewanella tabrizica TaxID=671278 RepID=A0ABQ2WRB0_9ALTE|nr:DUF1285 domain-containing protein [Alishewanella tabrizica]GGW66746.1 hypothetical protein GCM10008111_23410 [Alishewanella tabrizica]